MRSAQSKTVVVRALPSGDKIWPGFNRFLEVMEAQQFRQAAGSRTAFKQPAVDQLKGGGLANSTAQVVGGAGLKLPQKVMDAIQNWNVGRNLDQLSNVLTDPNAASAFRAMVDAPRGGAKAAALATRILYLGVNAKRSGNRDVAPTTDLSLR